MQWDSDLYVKGRLVEERSLELESQPSVGTHEHGFREDKGTLEQRSEVLSSSVKRSSEFRDFVRRISSRRNKRNSTGAVDFSQTEVMPLSESETKFDCDHHVPKVDDQEIPNAVFARKFGILTDDSPLPPCIRELPVAEDKAMDMARETGRREFLYSWRFRGPFTPQLWFDSGLEYRWKKR